MSFASVCAQIEADNRRAAMHETWGHLAAKPGPTKHYGTFLFIHGAYGDMVVVDDDFPTLEDNPWFFDARQDYIWERIKQGGCAHETGVYRWTGYYRMCKNGKSVFKGRCRKIPARNLK